MHFKLINSFILHSKYGGSHVTSTLTLLRGFSETLIQVDLHNPWHLLAFTEVMETSPAEM